MADPYQTLGVSKNADEAAIKSAYRKLAKELHPDRNKDNPAAAQRFSDVTRAYDLLSDKEKRGQYDRGEIDEEGNPRMPFGAGGGGFGGSYSGGSGRYGPGGAQFDFGEAGIDLGDILGGMFGGGGRGGSADPRGGFGRASPPPKGANIAYRLPVAFTDAATASPQRITLSDGKTIDLKLPAGIEDGQQMRLSGKGQAGPGGPGDAIVTVEIQPHSFYERDGSAIRLDLPITLTEAVAGAKVKVPTVDGPVMLTIPKNSSSGRVLRLKGKGFTQKGGGRGDQLVRLMIQLPETGDPTLDDFVAGWNHPGNVRSALGV